MCLNRGMALPERGAPFTNGLARLHKLSFTPHPPYANAGHDTRAIQDWLGHRSIQNTVRYTELLPTRFEDFWR
jgi:integrase